MKKKAKAAEVKEAMRQPVVALLVAPDMAMRADIVSGSKNGTIRDGQRDYRVGQTLMLCCHLDPWCVMATVSEVRHCLARQLTAAECRASGHSTRKAMLEDMRRFYPKFGPDSPVTFIAWRDVRGALIDEEKDLQNAVDGLIADGLRRTILRDFDSPTGPPLVGSEHVARDSDYRKRVIWLVGHDLIALSEDVYQLTEKGQRALSRLG